MRFYQNSNLLLLFPVFAIIATLSTNVVTARGAAAVVTAGSADARHLACVHTAILESPGLAAGKTREGATLGLGGVGPVLAAAPAGLAGELAAVAATAGEPLDSRFDDAYLLARGSILGIILVAGILLLVTAGRG